MTISIIIPNYNGQKLLKKNLPKVINLKKINKEIIEIILVDDGSSDNSVSFVINNFPEVNMIKKKENSGFVDTVNLGVSKAKGELVFLLNTDVMVQNNIIPRLVKYFFDDRVFAVGCLDKSIEEDLIIERGRGIGKFSKGFLLHGRGEINQNNTLWVSGGSGIFRKDIWKKLGGLDSLYSPFYWEDIDLSYRALKRGYQIHFEKDAVVIHEHMRGVILNSYSQDEIRLISFRNQLIFVWKNISDPKYLLQHLIYLLFNLFISLMKLDFVVIKAYWFALLRLPKIYIQRRKESHFWVKTDYEILKPFTGEFEKTL